MNTLPVVLFLSTKNAARSQFAEALLRHYTGATYDIYSAGLEPGDFSPYAKKALDEIGVPYAGQVAKDVKPYLGKLNVRYLITVSHSIGERGASVFPGAIYYFNWDFPNPGLDGGSEDQIMARYRAGRDQVDAKLKAWLQEIETMATGKRRSQTVTAAVVKPITE